MTINDDTIIVPEEVRILVLTEEERTIEVPGEIRVIEVHDDASGQ